MSTTKPLTDLHQRLLAEARRRGPGKPVGTQSIPGVKAVHLRTLATRGYGTYTSSPAGAFFYLGTEAPS